VGNDFLIVFDCREVASETNHGGPERSHFSEKPGATDQFFFPWSGFLLGDTALFHDDLRRFLDTFALFHNNIPLRGPSRGGGITSPRGSGIRIGNGAFFCRAIAK
jgi:hypothetical protein